MPTPICQASFGSDRLTSCVAIFRYRSLLPFGPLASNLDAADLATLTGKVVNVNDGDTLRVVDASGTQHRVRLQGIDSPATK